MVNGPIGRNRDEGRARSLIGIKMTASKRHIAANRDVVQLPKSDIFPRPTFEGGVHGKETVLLVAPHKHDGLLSADKLPILNRHSLQPPVARLVSPINQI